MCEFQTLYFEDDGYVVRCKRCAHVRLGFGSTMLSLSEIQFWELSNTVSLLFDTATNPVLFRERNVVLRTPLEQVCMLLSWPELRRFLYILERSKDELKALELIHLFNANN